MARSPKSGDETSRVTSPPETSASPSTATSGQVDGPTGPVTADVAGRTGTDVGPVAKGDDTSTDSGKAGVTPPAPATAIPTAGSSQAGLTDPDRTKPKPAGISSTDTSATRGPVTVDLPPPATPYTATSTPPSPPSGTSSRPSPSPAPLRSGFGGALLGGLLAGAIGFGGGWMLRDRLVAGPQVDLTGVETRLAALEDAPAAPDISALEAKVQALADRPQAETTDLAPLESRLDTLEQDFAALDPARLAAAESALDDLTARLDAAAADGTLAGRLDAAQGDLDRLDALLADMPEPVDLGPIEAEIASLREATDAARAAADEARALAEANAADVQAALDAAARTTALARTEAALAAGQPFAELGAEVPLDGALAEAAIDGVAPLATLRADFPDAARRALTVARAAGDEGSGVWASLRRSLSIRSTEPQQGETADAILSRAEARLVAGDLAGALAEIDALAPPVQDALQPWLTEARARAAAEAGLAALTQP